MSQLRGAAMALKRKRPGSGGPGKDLTEDELNTYNLIKSKGDMGIWKGDIRKELPEICNPKLLDNWLKSLQAKRLIKEVPDIQAKGKKRFMASEFEPSKDLTGGVFYNEEGRLDTSLIRTVKEVVKLTLNKRKVVSGMEFRDAIKATGVLRDVDLSVDQVREILDNMILEKEVVRIMSDGLGEFAAFPINVDCYKLRPKRAKMSTFSSLPCGVCPRINQCTPEGIISPTTCEYYTKWLEF